MVAHRAQGYTCAAFGAKNHAAELGVPNLALQLLVNMIARAGDAHHLEQLVRTEQSGRLSPGRPERALVQVHGECTAACYELVDQISFPEQAQEGVFDHEIPTEHENSITCLNRTLKKKITKKKQGTDHNRANLANPWEHPEIATVEVRHQVCEQQ